MFNKSYIVRKKKLLLYYFSIEVGCAGPRSLKWRKSIPRPCSVSFVDRLLYTEYVHIFAMYIFAIYILVYPIAVYIWITEKRYKYNPIKKCCVSCEKQAIESRETKLIAPHLKRILRGSELFSKIFFLPSWLSYNRWEEHHAIKVCLSWWCWYLRKYNDCSMEFCNLQQNYGYSLQYRIRVRNRKNLVLLVPSPHYVL